MQIGSPPDFVSKMTRPLFFSSNAIYPTSLMPTWLRLVSHLNPLTYQIDGLRALLLSVGPGIAAAHSACGPITAFWR